MNILPLNQRVTYWTPASVDGNGTVTWAAGVAVNARWAQKDGIVVDERGNNQKAEYAIYTETLVDKRCLVALRDLDGVPTPPDDARKVLGNVYNPSISSLCKVLA